MSSCLAIPVGWLIAGACALGATVVVASSIPVVVLASPPMQDGNLAAASGAAEADRVAAALIQRTCKDQCHTEDRITETRRAAFEWARLVVDMEARGARASEEEFAIIQRYLQRLYGFVNVNRASASDLRAVLGLEQKVAAAVVDHRKRNGPFVDIAALAEVPGLDRQALEAQADALRFN